MKILYPRHILILTALIGIALPVYSQENQGGEDSGASEKKGITVSVGGRAEMTYTQNLFRDKETNRYEGTFGLPEFASWVECDFGKGWSVAAELQVDAGATSPEGRRTVDVSLENLTLQKSFSPAANLKAGLMQVPVGGIINATNPLEYFSVSTPLGESALLPDTWLETGLSFWGEAGNWRYEAMVMPGLDSSRFSESEWLHNGADSPFEFHTNNTLAGAIRIDNTSVKDLRLGVSAYYGSCYNCRTGENKGNVTLGSFDFDYRPWQERLIARGSITYGAAPDTGTDISKDAFMGYIEAGYDVMPWMARTDSKLYLFGRYDHIGMKGTHLNSVAFGVNYFPVKEVVVKAEYSLLHQGFNQPALSVGVGFCGLFTR